MHGHSQSTIPGKNISPESRLPSGASGSLSIRCNVLVLHTAMFFLCLGAVRAGHEHFTLPWNYLLIFLNVFLLVCSGRINLTVMGLLPFALAAVLEVPFQWAMEKHYNIGNVFVGLYTLAMTILNVSLMVRRGYGKCLWQVVNLVSLFSAVCICIQILSLLMGIRLDKIAYFSDTLFKAWEFSDSFRACSIFSEPSHFAEFGLLSLYYYLLVEKNTIRAAILATALVLSTSALGIIGSILLLTLYLLNLNRYAHMRRRQKYLMILTAFAAGIGLLLWASTTSHWVVQRILAGGTSSARIWRAFDLYAVMDLPEKLLGIGIQNQEVYLNYYSITLPSDTYETATVNREFSQTLGYIACTTGLVGLAAFVYPFAKMSVRQDYRVRSLCLIFLFVCFTCCIFSRHIFAIYLIMIYAVADMMENENMGKEM